MTVDGTDLSMVRGDNETISVNVGGDMTLAEGDKIEFTVRKKAKSTDALIHKTVTEFTDSTALIDLLPADTSSLSFGDYVYDIQWTTADGIVTTIVETSNFELRTEVTY